MPKTVSWVPDASQVLLRAKITAKAPFDPADTLLFEYDSAAADAGKLNNLIGGISLEQFQRYDRVRVTLGMTYTLRQFRVVTWRMIYPAHRFSINLQAEGHRLDAELFMPRPNEVRKSGGRNNIQLNYDGWLSPNTKLVVRLFPDEVAAN
jgi:hypothetical protein